MTTPVLPPGLGSGNRGNLALVTEQAPKPTPTTQRPVAPKTTIPTATASSSPKASAITKAATATAVPPLNGNTQQVINTLKALFPGQSVAQALQSAKALGPDTLKNLGITPDALTTIANHPEIYGGQGSDGYSTSIGGKIDSPSPPQVTTTLAPPTVPPISGGSVGGRIPNTATPPAPIGNQGGSLAAQQSMDQARSSSYVPTPAPTQNTYQPGTNQKSIPPTATGTSGNPSPWQSIIDSISGIPNNVNKLVQTAQAAQPPGGPAIPVPTSNVNPTDINNMINSTPQTTVDIPNAPDPYQFKLNDFTKQADTATSQAFAPQYTALDQGKAAAQTQYGQSDSTVNALYKNLAQSDQTQSAANQAAYKNALQGAAQSTQDLQGNIADTYNNTAQSQADLMKSLGIQAAAPDALSDQTAASNFNQVQAAQQGKAQQDYVQNSANADQSYQGNMLNADNAQGAATRTDLVNQLNGVLNQYDQQKSSVASDQSQAALQLAQQLQGSDMSLQQANYGSQQDAYSNALQKAQLQLSQNGQNQSTGLQQAQLALSLQQAQDSSAQNSYTDQYNAQQAAIQNSLAIQNQGFNQNLQTQQQSDLNNYNTSNLGLSAAQLAETHNEFNTTSQQAAAAANAKANPPLTFDQGSPYSQWVAQQSASNAPPKLLNIINQITLGQNADGSPSNTNAMSSQNAFLAAVGIEAKANGIDTATAINAATSYWNNVLKQPPVPPSSN